MTSIVLGDDHKVFLDALAGLLERNGMRVVGTGRTLAEVVDQVRGARPDVCLLDRNFGEGPVEDGVAATLHASPRTKVIMLTASPGNLAVADALRSGAAGYVHKTRGVEHLISAIGRVVAGETHVDVPARTAEPAAERSHEVDLRERFLTTRERQCLAMLIDGNTTETMARRLGVSTATVRSHVQGVLVKLGVHSRLEAAALAVRHALVPAASLNPEFEAQLG
ncbi:response regulator transcription factor [Amycolatopsis sp. FDAARGOS 1241]|uniref:response regulator transcription factor n=1 Tax=Amycolatopsis sp. FDAARGOS 1241 TaxID=2778070 RepID=UPI00195105BF|nr:response regulator transcription factor [Amycolatopsis sp. FDAARGOS 1241]QRP44806.1 response regulator transcription factor [Amycolatopsis sp. FDAARGOS 1241]